MRLGSLRRKAIGFSTRVCQLSYPKSLQISRKVGKNHRGWSPTSMQCPDSSWVRDRWPIWEDRTTSHQGWDFCLWIRCQPTARDFRRRVKTEVCLVQVKGDKLIILIWCLIEPILYWFVSIVTILIELIKCTVITHFQTFYLSFLCRVSPNLQEGWRYLLWGAQSLINQDGQVCRHQVHEKSLRFNRAGNYFNLSDIYNSI